MTYTVTPYGMAKKLGMVSVSGSFFPKEKSNMKYVGKATNTQYKKKSAKPSRSFVKSEILKMATGYHSTRSDSAGAVALKHNTVYTLNLTAAITQGTTNANRQGDQIYLQRCVLKGYVASDPASGAYSYRVLVLWSPVEINPGTLGSGLGYSDIFLPSTGVTSLVNGIINPKAVTVIYDNTIDINSQIAATSDISSMMNSIGIYQNFDYKADGNVYGKKKNLYLIVIGTVVGGSGGTTAVGGSAIATDITFKNL